MHNVNASAKAIIASLVTVLALWPLHAGSAEVTVAERIAGLLVQARRAVSENRLTVPSGDNAVGYAQRVLDLAPGHPVAQQILRDVVARYGTIARAALDRIEGLKRREIAKARDYYARGGRIAKRYGVPDTALRRIEERIAAVDGDTSQPSGPIGQDPHNRELLARIVDRYIEMGEAALLRSNVAEARRFHTIASELAQSYQVNRKVLPNLAERIASVESSLTVAEFRKQLSTERLTTAGPLAIFLPPAF